MNNLRYFYRKGTNGKPLAGTLITAINRPKIGIWGEIKKIDWERKVSCCGVLSDEAILGITGPTGTITAGADEYDFVITSTVTGIPSDDVSNISLYIDDVFIETQDGNTFSYNGSAFAENPTVATVYYTVAVLADGSTVVSPIQQFTLVDTIPAWSFLVANNIMAISTTRHIIDRVIDVDLDTIVVTTLTLPSFCTVALVPVTGITGQSAIVVDVTASPGALDAGTYSFTLRANDGLKQVDKVISLVVDASAHHIITVRPATTVAITVAGGAGQALGTLTTSTTINQSQVDTIPQPNLVNVTTPSGTGGALVTTSIPTGPGKQAVITQIRNVTTGTGNRYEDSYYQILTIT
jgi:hypothetical protein